VQVRIKTFGCKVNFADSEELAAQLHSRGISADYDSREAAGGVFIINTCCVTATAVKKARQYIRRLQQQNPKAEVIVTGCAVREESIARELAELGVRLIPNAESLLAHMPVGRGESAETPPANRTRRFIKVQDGCNSYCSYCIVPFVRTLSSVPLNQVLDRVAAATSEGVPEIVLCGTNIGLYDNGSGMGISGLLAQVLAMLPETTRLRLSSIEPQHVDSALLELMRHPRMCPHLHLPLQSGSDRVLRDMGRPYTAAEFVSLVNRFRSEFPHGAVTTDIMVGYPSETDEDFAQTLQLVRDCAFERAHLFRFSRRPQTKAASLKLLPSREVRRRFDALKEALGVVSHESWSRFVGETCTVALERRGRGYGESYQLVKISTADWRVGLVKVRLESLENGVFTGTLA
jgi:threonylcarbamoyladenosine tRNA methylthiotransferase MtaB